MVPLYKGSKRRDLVKAPVRDPLGAQGFRFQVNVSGQETYFVERSGCSCSVADVAGRKL